MIVLFHSFFIYIISLSLLSHTQTLSLSSYPYNNRTNTVNITLPLSPLSPRARLISPTSVSLSDNLFIDPTSTFGNLRTIWSEIRWIVLRSDGNSTDSLSLSLSSSYKTTDTLVSVSNVFLANDVTFTFILYIRNILGRSDITYAVVMVSLSLSLLTHIYFLYLFPPPDHEYPCPYKHITILSFALLSFIII